MQIPAWLAQATGAFDQNALRLGASGAMPGPGNGPNMMDAARGIGSDMMTHFRAGQQPGVSALASPGAASAPGMVHAPGMPPPAAFAPAAPIAAPAALSFAPAPSPLASTLNDTASTLAPHLQGHSLKSVALHFHDPNAPQ